MKEINGVKVMVGYILDDPRNMPIRRGSRRGYCEVHLGDGVWDLRCTKDAHAQLLWHLLSALVENEADIPILRCNKVSIEHAHELMDAVHTFYIEPPEFRSESEIQRYKKYKGEIRDLLDIVNLYMIKYSEKLKSKA